MKIFIYRFFLWLIRKKWPHKNSKNLLISWNFLWQLTAMDFGRWIFKIFHVCNTCGSPAVIGCGPNGLFCKYCDSYIRGTKENI